MGSGLVITLRPQTPKHSRGSWSYYTDTSEPVDGNGAQNMVTVQSGFQTRDISISGPTRLPTALTVPAMGSAYKELDTKQTNQALLEQSKTVSLSGSLCSS
jgi:hypothetical protein